MSRRTIALAMTGASGIQYGLRLLECLLQADVRVLLTLSAPAHIVAAQETDLKLPGQPEALRALLEQQYNAASQQLEVYGPNQWFSPLASGSGAADAMVVCPCTSGTLAAIANGASDNLLQRAADVTLKEQRKLILVIREMPLSAIHLENMLRLARLGATVMPACPGFYHRPRDIQDLIDFVVARILDHLGVEQHLLGKWPDTRPNP